jgi:predicted MFS family arabinose efflux permease
MASVLLLLTLPIAVFDEPPGEPVDASPMDLLGTVRALGGPWVAVLLTLKLGESAAGAMVRPWLIDAGFGLEGIGAVLGVGGSVAGLLGALIGGVLAGRSRPAAVVGCALLQSMCIASLAVGGSWAVPLVWLEHVASGMTTAALFTAMMDRCRHNLESTDYTLQASLVVISTGVGASLSGFAAARLGYAGLFVACAAWGVLAAVGAVRAMGRVR